MEDIRFSFKQNKISYLKYKYEIKNSCKLFYSVLGIWIFGYIYFNNIRVVWQIYLSICVSNYAIKMQMFSYK